MSDLVEVQQWKILLGAWSTSMVILFALIIIVRGFVSMYAHQRSKRISQERRLLLIESKLRKLGRRSFIPNWERIDD